MSAFPRCPNQLIHTTPGTSGNSSFVGTQLLVSPAAENDYGLDLIVATVAYLRAVANSQGGLHYDQRFLPSDLPAAIESIGGGLAIHDDGVISVMLESETR